MITAGKELIHTINETTLSSDELALWWLGQHSFILKSGKTIVYIDPFLSDHGKRLMPSLLSPEIINHANYIIGTHNHRDHIDLESWPALSSASPEATFICPEFHRNKLLEELDIPSDRLKGVNPGDTIDIPGLKITPLPSAHEFLDRDEETGLYPFLGFIYETAGQVVYHPGDCCIYDGLMSKLENYNISLALLPINGRDAERFARNCIGNMTYQEAADLAGHLKVKTAIPTHFDMFPGNREDPGNFTEYVNVKYPSINTIIPRYGETLIFKV